MLRNGGKPKQRELTNNGLLRVQIDSSRVEAHQRLTLTLAPALALTLTLTLT